MFFGANTNTHTKTTNSFRLTQSAYILRRVGIYCLHDLNVTCKRSGQSTIRTPYTYRTGIYSLLQEDASMQASTQFVIKRLFIMRAAIAIDRSVKEPGFLGTGLGGGLLLDIPSAVWGAALKFTKSLQRLVHYVHVIQCSRLALRLAGAGSIGQSACARALLKMAS